MRYNFILKNIFFHYGIADKLAIDKWEEVRDSVDYHWKEVMKLNRSRMAVSLDDKIAQSRIDKELKSRLILIIQDLLQAYTDVLQSDIDKLFPPRHILVQEVGLRRPQKLISRLILLKIIGLQMANLIGNSDLSDDFNNAMIVTNRIPNLDSRIHRSQNAIKDLVKHERTQHRHLYFNFSVGFVSVLMLVFLVALFDSLSRDGKISLFSIGMGGLLIVVCNHCRKRKDFKDQPIQFAQVINQCCEDLSDLTLGLTTLRPQSERKLEFEERNRIFEFAPSLQRNFARKRDGDDCCVICLQGSTAHNKLFFVENTRNWQGPYHIPCVQQCQRDPLNNQPLARSGGHLNSCSMDEYQRDQMRRIDEGKRGSRAILWSDRKEQKAVESKSHAENKESEFKDLKTYDELHDHQTAFGSDSSL